MVLEINFKKLTNLYYQVRVDQTERITLGIYCFENVNKLVHLGSEVNLENEMTAKIRRRIVLVNRTFFELGHLFRSRLLTKTTKVKLYKKL